MPIPVTLVNVGTFPNDSTGDPAQVAFTKINQSLTSLSVNAGGGSGTVAITSPDNSVVVAGSPGNSLALAVAAAFQGAFNIVAGTYTYATLPSAAQYANHLAVTSDQGAAFSNGVYWQILYNPTTGTLAISSNSPLTQAAQSVAYSQQLTSTAGVGAQTWSLVQKTGTNTWALSTSGLLTGTPGTIETDYLVVQVSDSTGAVAQKTLALQTVASLTPAATPTFSPVAGTYVGTQNVTISCSTGSSTIYYTTNGSTPTTGSTVYTTPVVVTASSTIQAIATAAGFTQSAVGSAAYIISTSVGHYVGANGTNVNYFTPEFPFLDILKQGGNNNGYWGTVLGAGSQTPTNEEGYLQLDANGYPTTITALPGHTQTYDRIFTYVQRGSASLAPSQTIFYPAGAYTFTIGGGAGTLAFTGDVSSLSSPSAGLSIAGLTVTSTLAAGVTGTFTVNITTPSAGGFELYIVQTDPSSTGNYMKGFSMVQASLQASYLSGTIFHPTFKAALTGFSNWRAMKWLQVENDDLNLFFSAQLNAGATSGTLTLIAFLGGNYGATWPFKTGTYNVAFQTGQIIPCVFTTGSSAVTWSVALSANVVTNQLAGAGVMAIVPKTQGWAGRTPFTSINWGKQVPYEVCLQLGNEMNIDIWMCLPVVGYFTDTTMGTKLAQLAFNGTGTTMPGFTGLKATQKTYVEFGNEVWNFQYNSCRFSYSMGALLIPSQGNPGFAAQQWYGTQVGNIAAAFSTVYGSAPFAARVVVSMGTQLGQFSTLLPQAMNAADWVAQGGGHVAPYTQGIGGFHSNPYCPSIFPIKNTDLVAINALGDPKSAIFGLLYTDVYSAVTYPSLQSAGLIGALGAYIAGQLAAISSQPWKSLPHFGYESGDGLSFNNPLNSGDVITGVAITGTAGQFSCAAGKNLTVGMQLTIAGTFGGTGSITGYVNPTTYQVSVTNGSTTFTLQTLASGALTTTAGTPTGLTYTCNLSAAQTTAIGTWLLALVRDPRMAQFYYDPNSTLGGTGYLPAMYLYYKFLNHFQFINPSSTNATWGALENVYQTTNPLTSAPSKYQGIENFIAASSALTAVIDAANVQSLTGSSASPKTLNVTCAAADNGLLVMVGLDSPGGAAPTGITYNGVALTQIGNVSYVSNGSVNVSAWFLNSPTTGSSLVLSVAYAASATGFGICAIPIAGVNTLAAPTFAVNHATSAAGSVAVTGAGSNDIQVAAVFIRSTSLASGGAPQTHVITPVNGINGLDGFAVDSIVGSSAGNFSWTLTSGDWTALGVTVFG